MTVTPIPDRWMRYFLRRPSARIRLFCFPYAGGGASAFRTWGRQLPEWVEVVAVQLPGREDRFREKPFRSVVELVASLAPVLAKHGDIPFVFFGHSLGGLIAFELARHLRRTAGPLPVRLFISARRAPGLPDPLPPLSGLPDDDFVRELQQRYGGFPSEIATDPELRALFLPTVQADVELIDSYVYRPGTPLDCPISVYGGLSDSIAQSDLEAWQSQTTAAFRLQMLPGEHFFLNTGTAALLRLISEELDRELPT